VIVALPGGPGTLSEVRLAKRYGRPIIAWLERRDEIPGLPEDVLVEADFEKIKGFVRRHVTS
jgi:predicted Rossmann-fold nucleotide-binding protein